jgi:hypothetical protein
MKKRTRFLSLIPFICSPRAGIVFARVRESKGNITRSMKTTRLLQSCMSVLFVFILVVLIRPGVASADTGMHYPPAYTSNHADEDYSYLRNPALRSYLWDPVKYIPLIESGTWYLSLGGEVWERHVDAIFIVSSIFIVSNVKTVVETSIRRKLPTAGGVGLYDRGVIISYSQDGGRSGAQAARLVHKILEGIPASSLPIEQADFYLGINLETTDAIDLKIPGDVLRAADFIAR